MQAEYIVQKASELIHRYGDADPYYAAQQEGIQLTYKDIGSLKGAYFGNMKKPVIVISSALDENMQKIVCAHELGHHVLHGGQLLTCENIDFQSAAILEREANIFASSFLIDSKKALTLLSEGHTVTETAAILETSESLLCFLLNALKLTEAPESTFLK
jgi:Zn-dependent peptidase ImmA (M78 family)